MSTEDFNYDLPKELIAQTPLENRSSSKLMVLNRNRGEILHKVFEDITLFLKKGDVLVLNDTKVIPARLIGIKEETNAVIELLLLKDLGEDKWKCLAKPQKRLKEHTIITFGDNDLKAIVLSKEDEGITYVKFIYEGIFLEILSKLGEMPLPPYIHEKLESQDRYQTVYAKNLGSSAAPTAGLHFTNELLEKIKNMGVEILYVTLHVGLGTFRPVEVEDVKEHKMHSEYFIMDENVAKRLNKAKEEGRRIIAVGTTSTRVLETVASKYNGKFKKTSGNTDIFIYPGFKFKAINGLITNFHLPKSTLLMLVSALAGKDFILKAYEIAIKENYRFFSFGDAMLII